MGFGVVGVLFIVGLLFDTYDFVIPGLADVITRYRAIFLTSRNGLFFGSIYVYIGMFFAGRSVEFNNKFILRWLLLLCVILLLVEGIIVEKTTGRSVVNISIAALPTAICLFLLAIQTDFCFGNEMQLMIRKMSTAVYCVHIGWISIVEYVCREFVQFNVLCCFLIVIAAVTLSAYLIVKIGERNRLAAILV